jgi:DNA-binding XRE family transcriptional regulator
MAKKIGARIIRLYYALQQRKNPLTIRIAKLLEDVGELPRPEARDHNWAARTRENFQQALSILGPAQGIGNGAGIFAKVEWPDGCGPNDFDRVRGWVGKWLSARVLIAMPDNSPQLSGNLSKPAPTGSRRKKESKLPPNREIGQVLREARRSFASFWTQKELARHFKVSEAHLSHIETGTAQPSKKLTVKIFKWLESVQRELETIQPE